jgi:hypothetical protein
MDLTSTAKEVILEELLSVYSDRVDPDYDKVFVQSVVSKFLERTKNSGVTAQSALLAIAPFLPNKLHKFSGRQRKWGKLQTWEKTALQMRYLYYFLIASTEYGWKKSRRPPFVTLHEFALKNVCVERELRLATFLSAGVTAAKVCLLPKDLKLFEAVYLTAPKPKRKFAKGK